MLFKKFPFWYGFLNNHLTAGLILTMLLCTEGLSAQQPTKTFPAPDEMPYFPGCNAYPTGSQEKRNCSNQLVLQHITDYLVYPEEALQEGIEGIVVVSFTIEEDGTLTNPRILRDIGGECAEAALVVLEKMPRWEPATKGTKPVPVTMKLPVQFSLEQEKNIPFTVLWGAVNEPVISKEMLPYLFQQPVSIINYEGKSMAVMGVQFFCETSKQKTIPLPVSEHGNIRKKYLRKIKPGRTLMLIATIQQEGALVEVGQRYLITP